MGCEESEFNCSGVRVPALVLFLFYMNVSGMRPQSRLSSWSLTIPAPWVLFHVRWSFPLAKWFHHERLPPISLWGIGRLS